MFGNEFPAGLLGRLLEQRNRSETLGYAVRFQGDEREPAYVSPEGLVPGAPIHVPIAHVQDIRARGISSVAHYAWMKHRYDIDNEVNESIS